MRTRISDDKLFLPYVVSEYIDFTNDKEILDIDVPYLKSEQIPAGHTDLYKAFEKSDVSESLYAKAVIKIKRIFDFARHIFKVIIFYQIIITRDNQSNLFAFSTIQIKT